MEKKNVDVYKTKKERKRRLNLYPLLNIQSILLLFFLSCLIMRISGQSTPLSIIQLIVEGNCEDKKIINAAFSDKISKIEVNNVLNNDCITACELTAGEKTIVITFRNDIDIISCSSMFLDRVNIKRVDLSNFDSSKVSEMNLMFKGCTKLETINFGTINTNLVTNMERFCENCHLLKSIDLSSLNIASLKKIEYIFSECHELDPINFGTSTAQLEGMTYAFNHCHKLKSIDLSHFDTSGVSNMKSLFDNCYALENINFGNINTANVETMHGMFSSCGSLRSIDLSKFNTAKVKNMDWMFNGCSGLTELTLGNFDTSSLQSMYMTFNGCSGLASLDLSTWKYDKLEGMGFTFKDCANLVSINLGTSDSPCLKDTSSTFEGCAALNSVDFSNFDMSNVVTTNSMFNGCINLIDVKFGTSSTPLLEQMGEMFKKCEKLTNIDLSNFSFVSVKNMKYAFLECKALLSVDFGTIETPSLLEAQGLFQSCEALPSMDLSRFDFSKVSSLEALFHSCYSLNDATFGNIPTSALENMRQMFFNCNSLKSLDLSSFDFTEVKNMQQAFMYCYSISGINFGNSPTSSLEDMDETFRGTGLISVDLSSFDFTKVTNMEELFYGSGRLIEVNFGNSPTDSLEKMELMFQDCINLKSLDLSNFRTSKVESMENLFLNCQNMEYIDITSFDTSNVKNMGSIFLNCWSLKSLDISNFDTSSATNMYQMFFNCFGFRYLNLSHFLTQSIQDASKMFFDSSRLFYLNLYNFVFDNTVNWNQIFQGLSPYCIYCIKDEYTKNLILPPGAFCFCSDSCYLSINTKIDYLNERCLDSCENSDNTKYEYKGVCYLNCPGNTLMLDYLCIDNDIAEYDKYNIEYDATNNPIGYYKDSTDNVFKKCYDTCKYCNGAGVELNNDCIECKSNARFLTDFENDKNCYEICDYYYYFDSENKYHCTETEACPSEYKYLISPKKKCVNNCENDDIYKYPYYDTCLDVHQEESTYIETTSIETTSRIETTNIEETTSRIETTHIETTTKIESTNIGVETTGGITYSNDIEDITTNKVETTSIGLLYECANNDALINKCSIKNNINNTEQFDFIRSNILSLYSPNNFRSLFFEGENGRIYQLTNSKNELSRLTNDNYNISIVDLGECENILKQHYGIAEEDSLIILKQETMSDKASDKNVEYEILNPYNGTKLNISICSGTNINVYVPIELSDETKKLAEEMEELGYNIFDINDPFYRDYCTPYKSSSNTDVLLSDRVEHIYNNEDAKCQGNCKFANYIVGTKFINCTCDTETEEEEIQEKKIDKMDAKTLGQSFYYVLKYSNYNILKCYKLVFVRDVLKKNKGALIIFILFILYMCCLIWHSCQGLNPLKKSLGFVFEEDERRGKYFAYRSLVDFPPKKNKSAFKDKSVKNNKRSTTMFDLGIIDNLKSTKV